MKKDKANSFANKGGGMRLIAKRMREQVEEAEEEKVDVRKEDKTIRPFTIPVQKIYPTKYFKTIFIQSYKRPRANYYIFRSYFSKRKNTIK